MSEDPGGGFPEKSGGSPGCAAKGCALFPEKSDLSLLSLSLSLSLSDISGKVEGQNTPDISGRGAVKPAANAMRAAYVEGSSSWCASSDVETGATESFRSVEGYRLVALPVTELDLGDRSPAR